MCKIAIIGGSGLYSMPGLEDVQERVLTTPFGDPSAPIIVGRLEGESIAFLARHGIGHHLSPSEINFRANIYALKSLGVERIVSISACGSLREDYALGDMVIPDQLFDFTKDAGLPTRSAVGCPRMDMHDRCPCVISALGLFRAQRIHAV